MTRWYHMDLKNDGDAILGQIKSQRWFPYKTGALRDIATSGALINENTYRIMFEESGMIDYIACLEEGTKAHNIPNAFGLGPNFGIHGHYGKGHNKFHPGSRKHKGFISKKSVKEVIKYYKNHYHVLAVIEGETVGGNVKIHNWSKMSNREVKDFLRSIETHD